MATPAQELEILIDRAGTPPQIKAYIAAKGLVTVPLLYRYAEDEAQFKRKLIAPYCDWEGPL